MQSVPPVGFDNRVRGLFMRPLLFCAIDSMRTYIYVDGFNLYYGSLRRTSYKWLNLSSLFRDILQSHHQILKIKYFTARVSARPTNPYKPQRQDTYLRALQAHCEEVEVFFGHFLTNKIRAPLSHPSNGPKVVEVLKTEEKGSDGNLALHLLNDAWLDVYDSAIVVTNDSDIAEAMRLAKNRSNKLLGLITPGAGHPSQQLMQHANFHRHIRMNSLKKNQLPSPIPGTNITMPKNWHSQQLID